MRYKFWLSTSASVILSASMLFCVSGCSSNTATTQTASSETMGLKAVVCEQALLPTSGKVISYGSEKINLDFTVIDQFNSSELTGFNLKSVRLTDEDKNDIVVDHFYVTTSVSDDNHAEKHLHVTANLSEGKSAKIKELTVTYKSGTEKTFETGDLTIASSSSEATAKKEFAECELDLIVSDKDPSVLSGAVMYIPGCKSELTLESISTGISGLSADLTNISIVDEYIDVDELNKEIEEEEEWAKLFAKPREVEKVEKPKESIVLNKLDPKAFHTILIPFVCTKDYKTENTVDAYTMVITCKDKTKTYIYANQPTYFHGPDFKDTTSFLDIFEKFGK